MTALDEVIQEIVWPLRNEEFDLRYTLQRRNEATGMERKVFNINAKSEVRTIRTLRRRLAELERAKLIVEHASAWAKGEPHNLFRIITGRDP